MRDIIIIISILTIILIGTFVTNNYLDKTAKELIKELETLKNSIKENNSIKQELIQSIEEIYNKWRRINKKWSNIVLHEEIDSIEISIIKIKSKIKMGNLEESIEDIETSIFLLNHIREKEKISLKNIF